MRHAERVDPQTDALSVTGMRRARELRLLLGPLDAVYSTNTKRTWQTATPAALASELEIQRYEGGSSRRSWTSWGERMQARHPANQRVLIVGHSNTVAKIVRSLGGPAGPDLTDNADLFVLDDGGGSPTFEHRRYSVVASAGAVPLLGAIDESSDLSGAALTSDGQLLVVGSDEGTQLEVLRKTAAGYTKERSLALDDDSDADEIDIEGIARHGDGDVFYVVGSHSWRRRNIERDRDRGDTYRNLRARFQREPDRERNRERLLRVEIESSTGNLLGPVQELGLHEQIAHGDVLTHFFGIPSKENGIDIEGIASDGQRLYLGFRGPLLRHGYVPVLVVDPENPRDNELRYAAFEGRGVRDLAAVSDGFLAIAGPVGDTPLEYVLFFWDGRDCLPGVRQGEPPRCQVERLGALPVPEGGKAEGLVVLGEDSGRRSYELLILYDGRANGGARRVRASRPSP